MSRLIVYVALILTAHLVWVDGIPLDGCKLLVYKNITEEPQVKTDTQGICPKGNGPRAFAPATLSHFMTSDRLTLPSELSTVSQLKEVVPDPRQEFSCLLNGRCYLIIRGFCLRELDSISVLPKGQTECPPAQHVSESNSTDLSQTEQESQSAPVVIQSTKAGSLSNPRYHQLESWITAFVMPDRFALEPGEHTICYSPYLASRITDVNELNPNHFHYNTGKLYIGNNIFRCNFDVDASGGGVDEFHVLPCGFRNFQDRLNIALQWKLGEGKTEATETAVSRNAQRERQAGHYLYMDSPGFAAGAAATALSSPFALNAATYCMKFVYSMDGQDVSTFRVYLHELMLKITSTEPRGPSSNTTMLGLWGSPRWVAVGNKGKAWHQGGFEFTINENALVYQIVLEAIAGESEQGRIAVDDIEITLGGCPLEVRTHAPRSIGNKNQPYQPMVCGEVRLKTGLHADDKAWRLEKAVSCAGRGYSMDQMNNSVWLPCCVPHFGAYRLVLEDALGDGWTGSQLEFRFFDRVMVFGNDDEFSRSGLDKSYTLVIGSFEIVEVQFPTRQTLMILVRVARPNSYVWCGVTQVAEDGRILRVDLTPNVLKTYGVRSSRASHEPNEVMNVTILKDLEPNANYDVYCYSEVIGDMLDNKVTQLYDEEKVNKEIVASRKRVTIDNAPPSLMITSLHSTYTSINVTFTCDESAEVWCLAERAPPRADPFDFVDPLPLFSADGLLSNTLQAPHQPSASQRIARYFRAMGSGVSLDVQRNTSSDSSSEITSYIYLTGLIPGTDYDVLCYAEDTSLPKPNVMTPAQVQDTARPTRTESKTPSITIHHHLTLLRSFRLEISLDAPGQVWCAAAPESYHDPSVSDVVRAGAFVNSTEAFKKLTVDIHGVDANTAYKIYCVAGTLSVFDPFKEPQQLTTLEDMKVNALSLISYGRYCEKPFHDGSSDPVNHIINDRDDLSPFHPIRTEEEIHIRDFMLSRPELNLQGIYRINLLPNKTEIYNYYDGKGPKPKRYARVRVGRCVDNIGYYEQFRVGPLSTDGDPGPPEPMAYQRLARAVETECGGYVPQGVFGRLLQSTTNDQDSLQLFYDFMESSFGYKFPGLNSSCSISKVAAWNPERQSNASRTPCLQYGPAVLEEACDDTASNVTCTAANRTARLWLGLKTPHAERVPFFFIFDLPSRSAVEGETAHQWAQRLVLGAELPEDFFALWEASFLWYDGHLYDNIESLLSAVYKGNATRFTPDTFAAHALEERERVESYAKRRTLEPSPYPGAAGTAGPVHFREQRRTGLEYLAHPEHVESQGTRFRVNASSDMETYTLEYAGWSMVLTNDRDTGLRIFNLRFLDRRVAFEMGVMEALAHYTVSERNWFFLDSWYGGLGSAARPVFKGIECPKTGVSLFWDGSLCAFEQDLARPLRSHWRAGELRLGAPHLVLVLRQMITVSNYDYVTDYRFHATGMIDASVSFTGELYAGVEVPWYSKRQHDYGTQVTGAMRFAALHSHVLSWKIDFDVGPNDNWMRNSVQLTHVIQDPNRPEANKLTRRFAEREREAAFLRNDTRPLIYEVVDESMDTFTNVGGWRIHPYEGINPYNHNSSLYSGPASWAKYRTATTVRKYSELDITLPRDNKFAHRPAVTLDRYINDDEPIRNADLVTWISDGIFHVPVTEDMPLTIPVGNVLGWLVKPANLFVEDPSMDLYNAQGGGVKDPGTCAVVRMSIGDVEPTLNGTWTNPNAMLAL